MVRPGRAVRLAHISELRGTENIPTSCMGIIGARGWPNYGDEDPHNIVWPHPPHAHVWTVTVPDTAAPGENVVKFGYGCMVTRRSCTYRIIIPELLRTVSAESRRGVTRVAWAATDSSADSVRAYRKAENEPNWIRSGSPVLADARWNDRIGRPQYGCRGAIHTYRLGLPVETREIYRGDVEVVGSELPFTGALNVTIAPNPTATTISAVIEAKHGGLSEIGILDLSGRMVHRETLELLPGRNVWSTTASGLKPGVYFVRTRTSHGEATQRVVLSR